MAGSITVSLVGILLAISIGVILMPGIITLFSQGFGGFINNGFINFDVLFGTSGGIIFSCFIVVLLLILLSRFFISWIGEDSGGSANS